MNVKEELEKIKEKIKKGEATPDEVTLYCRTLGGIVTSAEIGNEERVNYHRLKSVASPLAHCIANKSPLGALLNGGDMGWFTGVTRGHRPSLLPSISREASNLYQIWNILELRRNGGW